MSQSSMFLWLARYFKIYFVVMKFKYLIIIFLLTNIYCKAQDFCKVENGYAHFIDNKKAKGVDFKIRIPEHWTIKEGSRPNVVANIKTEYMSFYILIKENITFLSRNQSKEVYESEYVEDMLTEPFRERGLTVQNIKKEECTIDSYPALKITYTILQSLPNLVNPTTTVMVRYVLFYEDYYIEMEGWVYGKEALEYIGHRGVRCEEIIKYALANFDSIAHSLVLFDHYK